MADKFSRRRIAVVATTAKTIKFFLINHIIEFSQYYDVSILCNFGEGDESLDSLPVNVELVNFKISRKIDIISDLKSLFFLIIFFYQHKLSATYSLSPKGGFLCAVAAWVSFVPVRIHTFTGQVWVTKKGLSRFMLKVLDYVTAALATKILIDSPSQKDFLENQGVVGKNKSQVIGSGSISGVDLNKFYIDDFVRVQKRLHLDVKKGALIFLFVGRLKRDKGIRELVKAFCRLSKEVSNAELWLVGDDEENMWNELRAQKLDNGGKIRKIPYTSQPEDYMKAADVFCLPSYREGFGTAIIEAASCGVPAIGTNIYGISDAILDNKTGLLVKVKCVDSLFDGMLCLSKNHALRKKMGEAAAMNVRKNFNSKKISADLLAIVNTCCS